MANVVGIDLGTTNSLVAYVRDGKPVVIRDASGDALVPSVVSVGEDGRFYVGREAQRRLLAAPSRPVYSVKRFMGRGIDDVRGEAAMLPFRVGGEPGGVVRIGVADKEFTPPEISAFVLRELKHRAEEHFREMGDFDFEVDRAVITVPAYFNDAQRTATRDLYQHDVAATLRFDLNDYSIPPEAVGNRRKLLVSDQAGRSNILAELKRIGIVIPKDDPRIARLLDEVKQREAAGYAYEAADASFELLARRMLGNVPQFFDVDSFRVTVERRHNAVGKLVTVSEATVKVRIDGETVLSAGEGNGPVNALDNALRKDLGRYQSYIDDLDLVDYKVRILTGGTAAVTRVLIESRDGVGNRWFTVGVSPNIVDASFEALLDSINYKLIRDGAPAP